MTRSRNPSDWAEDAAAARVAERDFLEILRRDPRLTDLEDQTASFDRLDFAFTWRGRRISLDLKEKRKPYSGGVRELWRDCRPADLFILDETVYRRIIWQGGGGFLVVHDHPMARWAIFGPWELTLGRRVRYQRWGRKRHEAFLKGKLLLDLQAAAHLASHFSVDALLRVVERAAADLGAVGAVAASRQDLPVLGKPDR